MKMKKALILALLTVLTATGYAQTTKFAMTIGTDLGLPARTTRSSRPTSLQLMTLHPNCR